MKENISKENSFNVYLKQNVCILSLKCNVIGDTITNLEPTPPKDKACSQKRGNVANVRSSRQGAKKLQFLSGCNF